MITPGDSIRASSSEPNDSRPLRVCCGPRCGADPEHRSVYQKLEQSAPCAVEPTLCRAFCGAGITVIAPNGGKHKLRSGDISTFLSETFAPEQRTP